MSAGSMMLSGCRRRRRRWCVVPAVHRRTDCFVATKRVAGTGCGIGRRLPSSIPYRLSLEAEARIVALRYQTGWGPPGSGIAASSIILGRFDNRQRPLYRYSTVRRPLVDWRSWRGAWPSNRHDGGKAV